MEAIDYVKLFKLDQENYDFKREEFISELGKEFLDYCQTTTIGIDKKTGNIYYYRFREIVKNFETKFWAISELKIGEPLTQKLIEEQKGITHNRSKQDKKPTNHKKANYGKGNHRPAWE